MDNANLMENGSVDYSGVASNRKKQICKLTLYFVPFAVLVWMITCCTAPVPKADDYDAILSYLNRPSSERLVHIADFHNEHRIFTARLVFEMILGILGYFDFTVCMAVGAVFLFGYGLLFKSLFPCDGVCRRWLYFPFLWLIVSFLNYDNVCWAMTSASNVQVHFWALLSLVLMGKSANLLFFALSLLCATLATFSTGAGMSVWGAMFVAVIHKHLRRCGSWRMALRDITAVFKFKKEGLYRLVASVSLFLCIAFYYFGGFKSVTSDCPFSAYKAFMTFLAFLGASIPIWSLALLVGMGVFICIACIIWLLPKVHNTLAVAFLAYLTANVLSAALFRFDDPTSVLACRMRLIPLSLVGVITVIIYELLPVSKKVVKRVSVVIFCGVVAYLLAFTVVSYPALKAQNEQLIRGIVAWPEDTSGLWYDSRDNKRVNDILRKSVENGIYRLPKVD